MPAPDNSDRDRAIAAAARLGVSHDSLAAQYSLSRPRISQIVKALRPRTPGEAERAEVAATLRRKYDELQRIVDGAPPRSSAIGRIVCYPEGHPKAGQIVTDDSVVIRAIAEQGKIMTAYRQMFGTDITVPPAPLISAHQVVLQNIGGKQEEMARITPKPPLPALPAGFYDLPPAEQARIQMARLTAQKTTWDADIAARTLQGQIEP